VLRVGATHNTTYTLPRKTNLREVALIRFCDLSNVETPLSGRFRCFFCWGYGSVQKETNFCTFLKKRNGRAGPHPAATDLCGTDRASLGCAEPLARCCAWTPSREERKAIWYYCLHRQCTAATVCRPGSACKVQLREQARRGGMRRASAAGTIRLEASRSPAGHKVTCWRGRRRRRRRRSRGAPQEKDLVGA
jgi:hypothetical protein